MFRLVCVRSVYTEAESIYGVIILVKRTDGRFLRNPKEQVDYEALKKIGLRLDLINPFGGGGSLFSLKSNFGW